MHWARAFAIRNAQRMRVHGHHLLHLVHAALQVGYVLAYVAQVSMDDEVAGEHERDVARSGAAGPPQPHSAAGHASPQRQQHHLLHTAALRAAHPVAQRASPPFAHHQAQALVLAALCAEGLHHRVTGHSIGHGAAHQRVLRIGEPCRRRDVVERQPHRERHIEHSARADHSAHRRPMPAQQHGGADEDQQRRQQGQQQRVVQHVHRPHAARHAPHDGAGKVVRMPVRREALHAPERIAREARHQPQREVNDGDQRKIPPSNQHGTQRCHAAQRPQCRVKCLQLCLIGVRSRMRRVCCDGVHQPPGEDRHEEVGHGRHQHGSGNAGHQPCLASPVAEEECKNVAHCVIAS